MSKYFFLRPLIIIASFLFFTSCSPVRLVPENQYLLTSYRVKCDNNKIEKEELKNRIRPLTNRKILGVFRFHLFVYNLFGGGKERKFKRKISEVVGEAPVLYNEAEMKKNVN